MANENDLTVDSLIRSELEGKAGAIGVYDSLLWKIRTAYALSAYAGLGYALGFVKDAPAMTPSRKTAALVVLLGLGVFAFLLDFMFMHCKLRVVQYRDRLVLLALDLAMEGKTAIPGSVPQLNIGNDRKKLLAALLVNTGERRGWAPWAMYSSLTPVLLLYGSTFVIATISVLLS